jgi:hypothetical protein
VGEHYRRDDDPPQDWWPKYLSLGTVANPFAAVRRMGRTRSGRVYLALDAFFGLVFLQQAFSAPDKIDGPIALGFLGAMMLVLALALSGHVLKSRLPEYLARRDDAFVVLGWFMIALAALDAVT